MSTIHAPAEVTIHGRHIEVSQKFREHVLHKIGRIEKFGIHVTRVDVEVTKEPNPRQHDHAFEVELTIAAKGPVIRAEASAPDKFTAFDLAYTRLEERLRRAGIAVEGGLMSDACGQILRDFFAERRRQQRASRQVAPGEAADPPQTSAIPAGEVQELPLDALDEFSPTRGLT